MGDEVLLKTGKRGRPMRVYPYKGFFMTAEAICAETGVSVATFKRRVGHGVPIERAMVNEHLYPRNAKRDRRWEGERLERLTKLWNEGLTLREIAPKFGVSYERIRQVLEVNGMIGSKDTLDGHIKFHELCDQMLIGRQTLAPLVPSNMFRRWRGTLYVSESDAREIRRIIFDHRRGECPGCGVEFLRNKTDKIWCSGECRRASKGGVHDRADDGVYLLWHKEALDEIDQAGITEHDWRTVHKLDRPPGALSVMQTNWIGYKGLISMKDHPTREWRGKPVRLYSQEEFDIFSESHRRFVKEGRQHERV